MLFCIVKINVLFDQIDRLIPTAKGDTRGGGIQVPRGGGRIVRDTISTINSNRYWKIFNENLISVAFDQA